MVLNRRHLRNKACSGKTRYLDAKTAEAAAAKVRQAAMTAAQKIYAYRCRFCGGHHVGEEK